MFKSLISLEDLHELISEDHALVLVDCRFSLLDTEAGRKAYHISHIPGAIYAHLDEDLSGEIIPGETGRHPLPSVDKLKDVFSFWGIKPRTQVIAYDDRAGATASRLWFLLRYMGHEAVAVLDGGWAAWLAAGQPVSAEIAQPEKSDFQPKPRPELIVDAQFVENILQKGDYILLDAREGVRFRGEVEPIDPIAGHIAGACSLPFAENLDENGKFLNPDQLKARFEQLLKAQAAENSISYCGSGVTACHNLLAMYHAGLGEGKLYPGSWSEWITKKERPIALGE
ncbi:MAG: sulfurtransferase [Microscillaceae bacterium]|nr:sulfurtransferase [Microscillaceae bacterium]